MYYYLPIILTAPTYCLALVQVCPKVQQIIDIWNSGLGVVSLHVFQNVIPVEAFVREACMIEALGM